MSMYKKASRLKLRIPTPKGPLAVEQLWDLKLGDLATVIKNLYEEKKKYGSTSEELAFLDGPSTAENKDKERVELSFDIAKDIYTTKMNESKEALADYEKKKEKNRILELIQKKKDTELEGKSIEELEEMLKKMG